MSNFFDSNQPVAIIGAGVMGTKVAWACARSGLDTRLFDSQPGKAASSLTTALTWSEGEERERVAMHLTVTDALDTALAGVQLAFENVPEVLELKRSVFADLSSRLPEGAFLGSNASSLMCSELASASIHPQRFFCLNFTDPRNMRLVELMTTAETEPATAQFAMAWAEHIGMIAIPVRKEQLGYSFNRLWRVIKKEVLRQISEGYATPEDIDRSWMLSWGMDAGPCGMMDDIGLHSIVKVEQVYADHSGDAADRPPVFLLDMVARGELGVISGKGFYSYPDPAYRQPGFLEGVKQADKETDKKTDKKTPMKK